jgi:hypothetical protein
MSRLARALILAATLAALNLAGMTAVAQAQPSDAVEQFRRGERASQEQNITEDATQQKLAERWNYYYQATRMSPAELKAWLQAKDRPDTPTTPPTQVPAAPVQPTEPNVQPTWLVVSLGGLAAGLAVVAGLALLAARRANRRARVGHAT